MFVPLTADCRSGCTEECPKNIKSLGVDQGLSWRWLTFYLLNSFYRQTHKVLLGVRKYSFYLAKRTMNQFSSWAYHIIINCSGIGYHETIVGILINCSTDGVLKETRSIQISNNNDGNICCRFVLWFSTVISWNSELHIKNKKICQLSFVHWTSSFTTFSKQFIIVKNLMTNFNSRKQITLRQIDEQDKCY